MGATGRMQKIYPDLASVNEEGLTCIYEVENAKKDKQRLIRLMCSYAQNPNIVELNYIVFERSLLVVSYFQLKTGTKKFFEFMQTKNLATQESKLKNHNYSNIKF